MDIIFDGARLFVAGPDTRPVAGQGNGRPVVGLRFRPGIGPLFLGPAAVELRDQRVDLDQLWPGTVQLADRLSAPTSLLQARTVLEEAVAARLAKIPAPDPIVELAARTWAANPSMTRMATLASTQGLSERQLQRRFLRAVGYGPKFLHRVLRFQAFLALSALPELTLAEIAVRCGYSDQAHLSREAASLGGCTPSQLRAARMSDVRNVQDKE